MSVGVFSKLVAYIRGSTKGKLYELQAEPEMEILNYEKRERNCLLLIEKSTKIFVFACARFFFFRLLGPKILPLS